MDRPAADVFRPFARFFVQGNFAPTPTPGAWRSVSKLPPDVLDLTEEVEEGGVGKGDVGGIAGGGIDEAHPPEMTVGQGTLADVALASQNVDLDSQVPSPPVAPPPAIVAEAAGEPIPGGGGEA